MSTTPFISLQNGWQLKVANVNPGSTSVSIEITSTDFMGSNYQNNQLIGRTPGKDMILFTDGGSGVLLDTPGGYTFTSGTGTITTDPEKYLILLL